MGKCEKNSKAYISVKIRYMTVGPTLLKSTHHHLSLKQLLLMGKLFKSSTPKTTPIFSQPTFNLHHISFHMTTTFGIAKILN